MLILSTFNSDYLQSPLQSFLDNFSSERIDIKYTDTNLEISLAQILSSEEKNQTIIISFRVIDLIYLIDDNKKIDTLNLKEKINELIKQITELKKIKKEALIVNLCPSPAFFYNNNSEMMNFENYFLKEMQIKMIHTLSESDINQHYRLNNFENKIEYKTRIPYNFEFYMGLACLIARKLHCIKQIPYKVIVVDCDNTLWTGVAGDVGPENIKFEEHNLALQKFLVKQKEQGVFICLSSKNEEETVDNVFSLRKDEMILKKSDIAFQVINRDIKSNSIKTILKKLKLINAKNAMFIDDSEREIDEVGQNLPEIFCVHMPQKIDEFNKNWAFDVNEYMSITQTDKDRLKLVEQEEALQPMLSQYNDPIDRLKARRKVLPLVISKVKKEDEDKIARIEQIPKRTNQFNLFPFSDFPEKDWNLGNLIENNEIDCFIATIQNKSIFVEKKSDDANLVSEDITALAVCKSYNDHLLVNGFFVSCRNTGLEVEYALAKHIAMHAESKNLNKIKFKFKKTGINKLAETFIDILCQETNKNSIVRLLLRHIKKNSLIESFLVYFFKKIQVLPIDFNKILNEEMIFSFSTDVLNQLDLYMLMRKTMAANAVNNDSSIKRVIKEKDLENAKHYLPKLQIETGNIQLLVEKFMTGRQETSDLTEMLIEQLKFLMSQETSNKILEIPLDIPLVFLGLNSLKLTCLSGILYKKLGVKVDIDRLLSPEMTVSFLLLYINQQKDKQDIPYKEPKLLEHNQTCLKISDQEKRIFSAEQSEGVTNSYRFHMLACFLAYELNLEHFKSAYERMIQFYDVFGFYYSIVNGQLKKSIFSLENRKINFYHEEINEEVELMDIIQKKTSKPLSMIDSNELIRVFIFETKTNKKYYIFFHIHHCIFDAFSLKICLETLSKFYNDELKSIPFELSGPLSYQDFVHYQDDKIQNERFQLDARKFWSQHLSICENSVEISPDKAITSSFKSITELKANRYLFEISQRDSKVLKSFARENGVTVYSVIISLFSILISHYTYNARIPIITAASGRDALFLDTPGFFVNLLIHAFDLKENKTFCDFVIENHKNLIAGIKFQDFSFSEIQKFISHNASQTVAIVFQNYEIPKLLLKNETAKLVVPKSSILDIREHCRFSPLTLFVQETQAKYSFTFEYAKAKYSEGFIKRISKNLLYTIRDICKNPNQSLQEISVVCDEEREQLTSLGQGPKLNFSGKISLLNKFQQIVAKYPDNFALCDDSASLTYKQVDQKSTNLAHALIEAGIKQGNYVGIFLDASYLFFIAELAVLKIGAVFIPLSKENPNERLKLNINDAKINFFIVDDNRKGLFDTNLKDVSLISIDLVNNSCNLNKKLPLLNESTDEFCVLYTSGSTGIPKGVILQEKGIFRVVESPNFIEVLPGDRMAQTAKQVFDAAQLECWLAWNHGASLVIFDKETILDINLFRNKLITEKITHMWLTAGLFDFYSNTQSDIFKNLRYLMVGGDVVHKDTVLKVLNFSEACTIINGYGPTEASIFVLTHIFNKQTINNFNTTLIGSPIHETIVEVLTPFGTPAPLGGIGELVVRGEGVAKGYLNSSLNKDRFIEKSGQRTYQTGDLVKYTLEDSQLMFMGRANEDQIKINGNLVALAEVRNCLSRHPNIKQVEVLVKNIDRNNRLVAYYTLKSKNIECIKLFNKELRLYLSNRLPAYMLPSFYIKIDNFILNSNGKLDKAQFQKLELGLIDNYLEEILPKTFYGEELLKIVKVTLKNFPNNIKADLFDYGCDSINVYEIINKINCKFNSEFKKRSKSKFQNDFKSYLSKKNFEAKDLYEKRTIQELENLLVDKLNNKNEKKLLRILKDGDSNLPSIVFIHPAGGGISCFDELIGKIKVDNICYGIEDPLLESSQLKLLSMEQMAQNYLSIILDGIPGSFILAGYSFGGMLALEMAAQYESISENDYLLEVFLFDTWVVSCANEEIKIKLKHDVLIYCAEQRKQANVNDGSREMLTLLEELCEHHQTIGFEFKPKKLISIPVCLFKSTNLNNEFARMNMQDKSNFLLKFVEEKLFNIQEIKATHFDLLEAPANNYLNEFFSNQINETNKRIPSKCSKLNKISMTLFPPLSEINNDPQFSCLKPRIK
ncbi:MAG: HAD-IIIC family phosphatase [Candidatus Aquirickettsiella sp.]